MKDNKVSSVKTYTIIQIKTTQIIFGEKHCFTCTVNSGLKFPGVSLAEPIVLSPICDG